MPEYPKDPEKSFDSLGARQFIVSWIVSQRRQLLLTAIIACLVPFALRYSMSGLVGFWDQAHTSLYVLLGILLSHIFRQELSRYPGEDPFSSVIPSVFLGYSLTLVLIVAGQLDYSRMILGAGFLGTLISQSAISILQRHLIRSRLCLAPVENANKFLLYQNVDWVSIPNPVNPKALGQVDGVVLDLTENTSREWNEFAVSCSMAGIAIYDSAKTLELLSGQVELKNLGDIGIDVLLPHRPYLVLKSVIDFIVAIVSLPLALIVIAVAAIAIKIDSRGPIFFVQERMGFRGQVFACYKLRSMTARAEDVGPSYTATGDKRITRVGKLIRKYRVDEVPQIFNILKGQMSWIGPRPEALTLAREYEKHIPFYDFRHAVKPGITGWAAIRQGNVAEVSAATEKLRNDFFYIKNISLTLDAFIAVRTIWVLATGFGSK